MWTRMVALTLSALLLTSVAAAQPAAQADHQPRPAAQSGGPEEAQRPEGPPESAAAVTLPDPSQALKACASDPGCAAKLQRIEKSQASSKARPAASEESPEERSAKTVPMPPQDETGSSPWLEALDRVVGWLNPIPSAQAATLIYPGTIASTFNVSLTPATPYVGNPYSLLYLMGVQHQANMNQLLNGYSSYTYGRSYAENKPYVYFRTTVPRTGNYLISISGSAGKAKLRHLTGSTIIAEWDYRGQTGTKLYTTVEYLTQGTQYFYFWPDASYIYFNGVTISSQGF